MTSSGTERLTSFSDAYKAASDRRPDSVEILRNFWSEQQGATPIDERGSTILHFLALHNNTLALRNLVDNLLLTSQDLKPRNARGDTPLHKTAKFGDVKFAEIMVEKGTALVLERNDLGETPLYCAAACGNEADFDFLMRKVHSNNKMTAMTRNDGCTVLHAAVTEEYYSLTINILDSFLHLAGRHDENGTTTLNILTTKPSSFESGSSYSLVLYDNDSLVRLLHLQNNDGKTASELFKENHSSLQELFEKAFKDMNTGLMLVSTLIGTINYTSLFTLPGGFDQYQGLPILRKKETEHDLMLFM